jgi:hypothetical protein
MKYEARVITDARIYTASRSSRVLAEHWAYRQAKHVSEFEKVLARQITTPSGHTVEYL